MKRSKVFLAIAAVFVIALAYLSYDISNRTTFPGHKSQLKERLRKKYLERDTTAQDSNNAIRR